jgi:hypothetical protein
MRSLQLTLHNKHSHTSELLRNLRKCGRQWSSISCGGSSRNWRIYIQLLWMLINKKGGTLISPSRDTQILTILFVTFRLSQGLGVGKTCHHVWMCLRSPYGSSRPAIGFPAGSPWLHLRIWKSPSDAWDVSLRYTILPVSPISVDRPCFTSVCFPGRWCGPSDGYPMSSRGRTRIDAACWTSWRG